MYTPQTPRLIFTAILATTLLSGFCTIAQQLTDLKKLTEYEESLRLYHNRKFAADRKEYLETTKKKWWYYLPNVGITLGMPTISTNTGTIAQIDRDRQLKKAKLEALQAQAEFQFREELLKLRYMYQLLEIEYPTIQEKQTVLGKVKGQTNLTIEGYNAQKVTISEMLAQDANLERERNSANEAIRRLHRMKIELEQFAHYNFPASAELIKFTEMDCEMSTLSTRPK